METSYLLKGLLEGPNVMLPRKWSRTEMWAVWAFGVWGTSPLPHVKPCRPSILIHGYSLPPSTTTSTNSGCCNKLQQIIDEGERCLNNRHLSLISGGWKFEIKAPTDPLCGKNPLPDSQTAIFSLYHHLAERVERGSKLMSFLIKAL